MEEITIFIYGESYKAYVNPRYLMPTETYDEDDEELIISGYVYVYADDPTIVSIDRLHFRAVWLPMQEEWSWWSPFEYAYIIEKDSPMIAVINGNLIPLFG